MRILTAMRGQVDGIADRAIARMPAEIPAYAAQDTLFFADVRDQVRRHYRVHLDSLLNERPIGPGGMPFVRPAAMRRAKAGFALEDYLCAFRIGQQVFWEALITQAGDSPVGHEAALSLATPVMRYNDYAATHASRVYVEFQQHRVADADRVRRDLLEHLLSGELPGRRPLLAAAQAHGLTAERPILVASVVPAAPDADIPQLAGETISRIDGPCGRALVVSRQTELVLVAALREVADAETVCDRLAAAHERLQEDGIPLAIGGRHRRGRGGGAAGDVPGGADGARGRAGRRRGGRAAPAVPVRLPHAQGGRHRAAAGGPAAARVPRPATSAAAACSSRPPAPSPRPTSTCGWPPSGCGCTPTRRSTACVRSRSGPAATRAGSPTCSTC